MVSKPSPTCPVTDAACATFGSELARRRRGPGAAASTLKECSMHHSRLCAVLIDCKTPDVNAAAGFWANALGRPVDPGHPGSRDNYRMLETPPDEPIVQIQLVRHESRVHIDIETD